MDNDQAELVRQLCTQIGMMMEDASVIALLNRPAENFGDRVATLRIAMDRALALTVAAQALCGC